MSLASLISKDLLRRIPLVKLRATVTFWENGRRSSALLKCNEEDKAFHPLRFHASDCLQHIWPLGFCKK